MQVPLRSRCGSITASRDFRDLPMESDLDVSTRSASNDALPRESVSSICAESSRLHGERHVDVRRISGQYLWYFYASRKYLAKATIRNIRQDTLREQIEIRDIKMQSVILQR